jgi:Xaa-Pro aminopeptidase
MYEIVLEAQNYAFSEILEKAKGPEVDKVARTIIEEKGYGKFFIHSLGHGVGLEVHEPPSLSEKSEDILVAGNTVTDEPGIYIPKFGGVRIEDVVLVTDSAPKRLTKFDRDLDSILI